MKKGRENGFYWEKQEYKRKIWKKNVAGFLKRAKVFFLKTKRQFWKTAGIEAKIRTKNKGDRENVRKISEDHGSGASAGREF